MTATHADDWQAVLTAARARRALYEPLWLTNMRLAVALNANTKRREAKTP